MVAYVATLDSPNSIDFAIPAVKSGPCSFTLMSIVEKSIAGNTENIPLMMLPIFDRKTARAMIIPARIPLNNIFFSV